MKYNYRKFKELNLFVIKYKGRFSFDAYKDSVIEFFSLPDHLEYFLIIVDLRHLIQEKKIDIIEKLAKERKSDKLSHIKFAYLVDNPKMTAIMELYTSRLQNQNYKYFSTLKGALQHLDIELSIHKELETYLSNN